MKDGIDIGEFIYGELIRDETIKRMVGNNIHPLAVKQDIKYPFIIYRRTSLTPVYSKDRVLQDTITMQIDCISDKYAEGVKLASLVRLCLDNLMKYDKLYIRLEDVKEEVANFAFTQSLSFTIKINY